MAWVYMARLSLVGYTPMGFPIAAIGRRALWPVMDGAETNLYLSEVTEKLKNPLFRTNSNNLSFFYSFPYAVLVTVSLTIYTPPGVIICLLLGKL